MAARGVLFSCYHHQGQICAAGTRLLVQRSVYDEFLDRLMTKIEKLRVGWPEDPDVHMGPLISSAQYERVHGYVVKGKQEGAHLLTGGSLLTKQVPPGGFYYRPTIFTKVSPEMTIAQEEIFGPVLAAMPFED
jgi:betaine-aldehyde dehydrogenase